MRPFLLPVLAWSAATASVVPRSDPFAEGLIGVLEGAGLATLVSLPEFAEIIPLLESGEKTLLAPTNKAFADAGVKITKRNDPTQVSTLDLLKYHVLQGCFLPDNVSLNDHTIARSELCNPDLVKLPGGKTQAVVLTKDDKNNITILEAIDTVNVVQVFKFKELVILVVDKVLCVPTDVISTAISLGLSGFAQALDEYWKTSPLSPLSKRDPGFDPSNVEPASILGFQESTSTRRDEVWASPDLAEIANQIIRASCSFHSCDSVLTKHSQAGLVFYEPFINGVRATTAGGGTAEFDRVYPGPDGIEAKFLPESSIFTNSTGTFIKGPVDCVRLTRTDVLHSTGVLHIAEHSFANSFSNITAAKEALAAANANIAMGGTFGTLP